MTDDDSDDATVDQNPSIDVVKLAGTPVSLQDGRFAIVYSIEVTNTGDVSLDDVQVTDGLDTAWGVALSGGTATIASGTCVVNANYDGVTDTNLLAGTQTLAVGQACIVGVTATVDVAGDPTVLGVAQTNTADATGTPPGEPPVTDDDSDDATVDLNPDVEIVKSISSEPVNNGAGVFTTVYQLDVTNTGDVALANVQVIDDIETAYAAATTVSAVSLVESGPCTNGTFDGFSDQNVLSGTDILTVGEACVIEVTVVFEPGAGAEDFVNQATVIGVPPGGPPVTDSDTTDSQVETNPAISLVKTVVDPGPVSVGGSGYAFDYSLVVTNIGDVPIVDLQIVDELDVTFADANGWSTDGVVVDDGGCTASDSFDGDSDPNTLVGTDTLLVGESCTVVISVTVLNSGSVGPFDNLAVATGQASVTAESLIDESLAVVSVPNPPRPVPVSSPPPPFEYTPVPPASTPTPTPPPPLAVTGSNPSPATTASIVLLMLGGTMVVFRRRRHE